MNHPEATTGNELTRVDDAPTETTPAETEAEEPNEEE